jgi:hypothetical protein
MDPWALQRLALGAWPLGLIHQFGRWLTAQYNPSTGSAGGVSQSDHNALFVGRGQ